MSSLSSKGGKRLRSRIGRLVFRFFITINFLTSLGFSNMVGLLRKLSNLLILILLGISASFELCV